MKEYDLIVSLGGSCATACQLKTRNLRKVSMPLDYVYSKDSRCLEYLAKALERGFDDWCLQENLVLAKPEEMRPGGAPYQYFDTVTHYMYVHDFEEPCESVIEKVREKFKYRLARFKSAFAEAERIALVFDTENDDAEKGMIRVREAILRKYGAEKQIDCYLLTFDASKESVSETSGVVIREFSHPRHLYLFHEKCYEFDMMDEWQLSDRIKSDYRGKSKTLYLQKTHKGVSVLLYRSKKFRFAFTLGIRGKRYHLAWGRVD